MNNWTFDKEKEMKLIMLYGPPGVGKLTIMRALGESTGYSLLHNHLISDLVVPIFGFRTPASNQLNVSIRSLIYETAAKNGWPGIISTSLYYADSGADEAMRDFVELMRRYSSEIFFVKLFCRLEVLRQRVVDPSRVGTKKITSPEKLELVLKTDGLMSTLPAVIAPSLEIDNSDLSPDEVVSRIMDYCQIT